jgi:hypothetical protein
VAVAIIRRPLSDAEVIDPLRAAAERSSRAPSWGSISKSSGPRLRLLLDELARAFARAALDRLLEESAAREPRPEGDTAEILRQVGPRLTEDGQKDCGSSPVARRRLTE